MSEEILEGKKNLFNSLTLQTKKIFRILNK